MEAALDLVGEGGAAAVTVRSVCRKAGLTDRYFYESFATRDELLVTLFNEVSAAAYDAVTTVIDQVDGTTREKARAAVLAILALADDDPRKGRLLFREPFSEGGLIAAGLAGAPALTRLLAANFAPSETGHQRALHAVSLGGALTTLLATYQLGTLRVTAEELVEHCASLIAPE
jgi:AcrR family transcriptional regulator